MFVQNPCVTVEACGLHPARGCCWKLLTALGCIWCLASLPGTCNVESCDGHVVLLSHVEAGRLAQIKQHLVWLLFNLRAGAVHRRRWMGVVL